MTTTLAHFVLRRDTNTFPPCYEHVMDDPYHTRYQQCKLFQIMGVPRIPHHPRQAVRSDIQQHRHPGQHTDLSGLYETDSTQRSCIRLSTHHSPTPHTPGFTFTPRSQSVRAEPRARVCVCVCVAWQKSLKHGAATGAVWEHS